MYKTYSILFISLLSLICCRNQANESHTDFQPKIFRYQLTKAPLFFDALIQQHQKDFHAVAPSDFDAFVTQNNIKENDSANIHTFYTFKILHQLFTSTSASNYSRGEILNIPYFWHWTTPNPRHGIIDLATNRKLTETKSPKEFSKYQSFADIDRTPYLFLSDLVSSKPKYHTSQCGNFNTFGWCSEREMAFVALLSTLGFEGKVITNGNHSWSEFIVPFTDTKNIKKEYKITIDNTFDKLKPEPISANSIIAWKKKKGIGLGEWYNKKAHEVTELSRIKNLEIPVSTAQDIEENVFSYLIKQHQ
ncbi:MAG TPA: hypothetical protein VJL37_04950 [Flavobacterium sp.]|nr:hypothetical protein [Flavobacterium sp.]